MNTVVNGGAIVEECLLSSNGGRDISLSAINGSINSNEESTSPPLYVETRLLYNCGSHSTNFYYRSMNHDLFYLETNF